MNGNRRWMPLENNTLRALQSWTGADSLKDWMQDTKRQMAHALIEQTKKTLANPDDWLITVKMEQGMPGEIISSVELTPLLVTQTFTIDNGK